MTPEQVSIINTVAMILDKIGTWPIGTILFMIVIGPWAVMVFIAMGQEKRFKATKRMYENNVELVKAYESVAKNLQEIVIFNTQIMTQVKDRIDSNLFCPVFKQQTKKTEVGG